MTEKLSERLEAEAARTRAEWTRHPTMNPGTRPVHPEPMRRLLREAAAVLRAVEGAATGRVDILCARDAVVVDEIAEDRMLALHKQRVALVPLDAAGSAEGVS